ncbi:MAG: cyanophycinase [Aureliella sp.]
MRATTAFASVLALAMGIVFSRPASGQISAHPASSAVEPAAASPRTSITLSSSRVAAPSSPSQSPAEQDPRSNASVLGALLLCGGGPMPEAVLDKFFEMGQAQRGSLVIIPSASTFADGGDFTFSLEQWKNFPWASVRVLHARDRKEVEKNAEFVKPLEEATAVWISGGDQRRLAERYLGTPVEAALKNVVTRGGIVGGTSAGSAIASRVMISGGRQQPVIANGLDLLPGAIIDQHFSQRKRYERLAYAVKQHPDRVGIGIDESTGLVVSKRQARVLGAGAVYVYPRPKVATEKYEPLRFESGSAFSLSELPTRKE